MRRGVRCPERLERRELLATLGDLVWHDLDGDGVQQAGEGGVPGAVVELRDLQGQTRGIRITDPAGGYAFSGFEAGDYELAVRLPVGFEFSPPDATGEEGRDSDFAQATGRSGLFSLGASDDLTWDAGLRGASPDFGFALRAGNGANDRGKAIAVDASGDVYLTGSFTGTVDFDHGPSVWNLTSLAGRDIFIARYTSTGALVWARSLPGSGADDEGLGIGVDGAGRVLVTGRFSGTVDLDPGEAESLATSAGGDDLFLTVLDAGGEHAWSTRMGGSGDDAGHDVAVDAAGRWYLTGQFQAAVDFDPGPGQRTLTAEGSVGAFFLHLDSAGLLLWAQASGGSGQSSAGVAIAPDRLGNVYAAGRYSGTTQLGPTQLDGRGATDIFVTRLNPSGEFDWVRAFGGLGTESVGDLAVDGSGNLTLAGGFERTVDFDPGAGQLPLTAIEGTDAFIARLNAAGQLSWARAFGGSGSQQATGVALDANGNVYATGRFHNAVDFDPGFGTDVLSSVGGGDIFVTKVDAAGNHVKALAVGGEGSDEPTSIAVDALGRSFLTGFFSTAANAPADFDPGAELFGLESAGGDDLFVARLSLLLDGNSSPVLTPVGIAIPMDEDQATVTPLQAWINAGPGTTTIRDVDAADPLGGIAVIGTEGRGAFSWSLDGVQFVEFGPVSPNSALLLPPDVKLRYAPDQRQGEVARLTYRAWDGSQGAAGDKVDATRTGDGEPFSAAAEQIEFRVAEVNDAPVLEPHGGIARTDEDTPLEFAVADLSDGPIGQARITDADAGDPVGGVALTGLIGFGELLYSLDGSGPFVAAEGIGAAQALLLPPEARLRYVPRGDRGETVLLTYRAWDQSQGQAGAYVDPRAGGDASAFSQDEDTVRIEVDSVNDAPLLTPAGPSTFTSEDNPVIVVPDSFINQGPRTTGVSDVDSLAVLGAIAVTAASGRGEWEYSFDQVQFQPLAAVSTAQALLLPPSALIRYTPDSANGEVASLTFRAWDRSQGSAGDRVSVADHGGTSPFSSQTDTLWINVTDVNDPPLGIQLDHLSLPENLPGAVVGRLTVSDLDAGETHTFNLSDNRFEVVENRLKLKDGIALDHEAEDQLTIGIMAIDSGSLTVVESFTLDVLDVNERPSLIMLTGGAVEENVAGAVVGQLTVVDVDAEDEHTLSVSDNRFEIVDGRLRLLAAVSLDHERDDPLELSVTAVDRGGLMLTRTLWITVRDVNEAPRDVQLSGNTVVENQAGVLVGELTVTDPDEGQHHTFAVSDSRFEVQGRQLRLKPGEALDFEAESEVSLEITATDSGTPAASVTVPLTIQVRNVNEPPTRITLTPAAVDENQAGVLIGTLAADDPETADRHTFQVSDDRFEVQGNGLWLRSGVQLNHEQQESIELLVTAVDDGQPARQASWPVTVQVRDVNEPPEWVVPLPDQVGMSNRRMSFAVPDGAFHDVDQGDRLVLAATSADGGPLPGWLRFDPSSAAFDGLPSIHDVGQVEILVTVSDQGNLTAEDRFLIDVLPAPAPWQHPRNPMDVNDDGMVSPLDILILINYINTHPNDPVLPTAPLAPPPFYDPNGDNLITPADIIMIVNFVNAGGVAEGEGESAPEVDWEADLTANSPVNLPANRAGQGSLVRSLAANSHISAAYDGQAASAALPLAERMPRLSLDPEGLTGSARQAGSEHPIRSRLPTGSLAGRLVAATAGWNLAGHAGGGPLERASQSPAGQERRTAVDWSRWQEENWLAGGPDEPLAGLDELDGRSVSRS